MELTLQPMNQLRGNGEPASVIQLGGVENGWRANAQAKVRMSKGVLSAVQEPIHTASI